MMSLDRDNVRVREVRAVCPEIISLANRRQQERSLAAIVNETWLELICEDDSAFRPEDQDLVIAVPPCAIAKGDLVDPAGVEHVATAMPPPPASLGLDVEQGHHGANVPAQLTYVHRLIRADDGWITLSEWLPATHVLFETDATPATLDSFNAFARIIAPGTLRIDSYGSDRLALSAVCDEIFAWSTAPVSRSAAFGFALAATYAMIWIRFRQSAKLTVLQDTAGGLVVTDERGAEARCPVEPLFERPQQLPADYFSSQTRGRVEALRISKPGGLGRDATGAVANCRLAGQVTFTVDERKQLVISTGGDESEPLIVDGPEFTTLGGRRNVPIEVPYRVALAIVDGAERGPVEVTVADGAGSVFRDDYGILLQWRRRVAN